jgi:hypothetical protein
LEARKDIKLVELLLALAEIGLAVCVAGLRHRKPFTFRDPKSGL